MPDGSIHSIQVGLQMVEEFRLRCKESVEEDPLEKVAVVYEGVLTKIKSQHDAGNLEEFIALCPTLSALYPSLYRYFLCLKLFIALKSVTSKNQPPFYHEIIQFIQNRIQLKSMLERGQISLRKYLRTLGRMNHVVKGGRARRGGRNLGAASLLRGFHEFFW